jgi:hypothetical protein
VKLNTDVKVHLPIEEEVTAASAPPHKISGPGHNGHMQNHTTTMKNESTPKITHCHQRTKYCSKTLRGSKI